MILILSCEHGGNIIPEIYKPWFADAENELNSHRGLDFGALDLFRQLQDLAQYSQFNEISRLLVEVNRSLNHPALFSEFTKNLSTALKKEILESYYFSYRNVLEEKISEEIRDGNEVLHLSIHSFTPVLNGQHRKADIGILYDPQRPREKSFSKNLKEMLQQNLQELKVRSNYPYLGKADGFTTYLRRKFPEAYLGIELEINQKYAENNKFPAWLKTGIFQAVNSSMTM